MQVMDTPNSWGDRGHHDSVGSLGFDWVLICHLGVKMASIVRPQYQFQRMNFEETYAIVVRASQMEDGLAT